jgi:spore maturation protein CgeB
MTRGPDQHGTAARRRKMVFLGLSITSSWGNGHATTYRALLRALADRGHEVLFLERDLPWYADNRDLPCPPFGRTALYQSLDELRDRFTAEVREADLVVVGSYVPDGILVGEWVLGAARGVSAFYDIDTPVTMARLARAECDYLSPAQIARYQLYLSFTGGPLLAQIAARYRARAPRPLYCAVDPALYFPSESAERWDLGYLGTYSPDRQPMLERLLTEPARRLPQARFCVAGPQYPDDEIAWPPNVERTMHLSPAEHRAFYRAQRFTLNVTRADMTAAGFSPSVRLFEAAACATPILTDPWPGLETIFTPGREILVTRTADEVLAALRLPEAERRALGDRARARALGEHTAAHRAQALEGYLDSLSAGARENRSTRPERRSIWPRSS